MDVEHGLEVWHLARPPGGIQLLDETAERRLLMGECSEGRRPHGGQELPERLGMGETGAVMMVWRW